MRLSESRDVRLRKLLSLPQAVLDSVLAEVLERAVHGNDKLQTKGTITRFHAKTPSKLPIADYLHR